MHRWSAVVAAAAGAVGAAVLAVPAQAGTAGVVVKVTPDQGLKPGQTVTVSGHGLPKSSGGSPQTWFVTECTAAVRGRMDPSTDTPHCDITHAQAVHVEPEGHLQLPLPVDDRDHRRRLLRNGGHATCVIGVGTAQGLGTVVRISFKTPPAAPTTPPTTTSTTAG